MKKLLIAGAAMAALGMASQAHAWTGFGNDTLGPSLIITIDSSGVASIGNGPSFALGPYDGSDDTYIGVVNNYSKSVGSLNLSSSGADIFGFDGDGIDTYGAPGNSTDTTGYGGPMSYFTNINAALTSGTVNFIGGLGAGAQTYFSLEEPLDTATFRGGGGITTGGVPEPATWAMMVLGVAGIGGMLRLGGRKAVTA